MPGWLGLTGRRMEDELGDGWTHGVHPDDLALYLQTYLTAIDARAQFTMEYRLRRHDGEYRWVLDTGVPRYDADRHFAGYVGSCIDITDRRRIEERLHEVGGRLLTVQEEERRRVARELHDDLSQQLALLASELEQLSVDYPEPRGDVSQRLMALSRRATTISSDAYRLSHQLHPSKLEALGLVASLRSYCREVSAQQKIHVSFTHGDVPASIPMDISFCVYRIVQEALRNVAKHSGADEAHVQLLGGAAGSCLRIADGGAGFDPDVDRTRRPRLDQHPGAAPFRRRRAAHPLRQVAWHAPRRLDSPCGRGPTPPRPDCHPLSLLTGGRHAQIAGTFRHFASSATAAAPDIVPHMHANQHAMLATAPDRGPRAHVRSCPSRLKVVAKAQAVLQEQVADEPIAIAALSEAVGVSERTLRNAFTDVYRQSPKRYLVTQRLLAVRHALRAAATPGATVTGIATDHGFFELGRFALKYKAAFGESPSHTLRGTGRVDAPATRRLTATGDRDAMDGFR